MNLTGGQKIMCAVVLAVAVLLAASIRSSCSSDGAGSVTIPGSKDKLKKIGKNGPGKRQVGTKKQSPEPPRKR